LSPEARETIRQMGPLLCAGCSERTIAEHLGQSRGSVRARVAELRAEIERAVSEQPEG
jgi:DNA-directed RNA polymerase specialized sigma24 family protein